MERCCRVCLPAALNQQLRHVHHLVTAETATSFSQFLLTNDKFYNNRPQIINN